MASPHTLDPKVVRLGDAVFSLRQDIDIHRGISLNVSGLAEVNGSGKFFGWMQQRALTSIALMLCKIFERNTRWPLCSIPAIIDDLPTGLPPHFECDQFERFIGRFGASGKRPDRSALEAACGATEAKHKTSLQRLKTFRDKHAAHLEFGFTISALPSHNVFEELWKFASDFYALVHKQYNDIVPAPMSRQVLAGYERTLKQLGVKEPVLVYKAAIETGPKKSKVLKSRTNPPPSAPSV